MSKEMDMAINALKETGAASESGRWTGSADELAVIDHLMAGGVLLPAQLPSVSYWSAEKRLAAAVLASALVEIRDHHGARGHRRRVAEAIDWVQSDDSEWPYSFIRLCALFGLVPEWVRAVVRHWIATPRAARKSVCFVYRQAA
jgi:hypothetical protein